MSAGAAAGLVGLGNMGRGIAGVLRDADDLAAVWDLRPEALDEAGLPPEVVMPKQLG